MSGEEYKAKLEKETEISLRDHPERWRLQTVAGTKHYQLAPYKSGAVLAPGRDTQNTWEGSSGPQNGSVWLWWHGLELLWMQPKP
jgi:hypothetical protein